MPPDAPPAVAAARTTLESSPECEGCSFLLTAVAASGVAPFRLPLRRRRQFWLRLAHSNRSQAIALGLVTAIGFTMELAPFSKAVIIASMFAGRVGVLTLVFTLAGQAPSRRYELPDARLPLN